MVISNDLFISPADNIYNGCLQLILSVSPTKLDVVYEPGTNNSLRVGCFIFFFSLIVLVYSFDTICNATLDLFKPLLEPIDKSYEILRLRGFDRFLSTWMFLITFLHFFNLTGHSATFWDWKIFQSMWQLDQGATLYRLEALVNVYRYFPAVMYWIPLIVFYYMVVRRPGPDADYNSSQRDILPTRNIMNIGYEYWQKHTVRWNTNFALTLEYLLNYSSFILRVTTSINILPFSSQITYSVQAITLIWLLIWAYGLICTLFGHCAVVPFYNRAQQLHVGEPNNPL